MPGQVMRAPASLSLKPDLAATAKRWEANFAGELLDRPPVWMTCPRPGRSIPPSPNYHERVHGEIEPMLDRVLARAEAIWWGGDAVPEWFPSLGPDELAAFCGGSLLFSPDSADTNWSVPIVEDWEKSLPLRLQWDHPLWQRLLALYRRGAEKFAGKMLLSPPDLHSNMDLLAAVRGPQQLCLDLLECPELIDRAMADTLDLFREVFAAVRVAGRMDEHGFSHNFYSMEGLAVLQCDFCCMMSPAMFRRWVLPALEAEAVMVRHASFHWDGPGALVHAPALFSSRGLYALSYVPGAGHGRHVDMLDLLKAMQAAGKVAHIGGTPDEIKFMHRQLRPNLVAYYTGVTTPAEGEELLEWLTKNC